METLRFKQLPHFRCRASNSKKNGDALALVGKRDHFVPRNYLRQFAVAETDRVAIATIDPRRYVGLRSIDGQCQKNFFYEKDQGLSDILWRSENDLAPVLLNVTKRMDFDSKERVALNLLAAVLHLRTKSAVEHAKIFPRRIAHEVITHGIRTGRLPDPKGGWREDMMDFGGVPETLIKEGVIPCWMEMQTLECKLLTAPSESWFVTSDTPVAILNQFCVRAHPLRSFVGFSLSGFQLLLPLSPRVCAFFYDAKVYKVGTRRRRLLEISLEDVAIVNSLQVQSADNCLYFHDPRSAQKVEELIRFFGHLRTPITDTLRTYPGRKENEEILHHKSRSVRLPVAWSFCRRRRRVTYKAGDRRDPAWSYAVEQLSDDLHRNPGRRRRVSTLEAIGLL